MQAPLAYTIAESPVGPILLAGDGAALHYVSFSTGHKSFGPRPGWQADPAPFAEAIRQLAAYFDGTRRIFDIPLAINGSPFEREIWDILRTIPFGQTRSYGSIARQMGDITLSRAVGTANGNNPLPIVIPCHRVIGADGSLTGFGGGIETKRFLLRLEDSRPAPEDGQLPLL